MAEFQVRVASYNLRGASAGDPAPRNWATRAPYAAAQAVTSGATLIGVQEASYANTANSQGADLAARMNGISGSAKWQCVQYKNRAQGIIYDTTVWSPVGSVASVDINTKTWPVAPRYLMWMVFQHIASGTRVTFANTHWTSNGTGGDYATDMRWQNAQMTASILQERGRVNGYPLILTGDFNTSSTSGPRMALTSATFRSIQQTVTPVNGTYNSFNGFDANMTGQQNGQWIDGIYYSPGITPVNGGVQLNFANGSTLPLATPLPSDHNLVYATLNVPVGAGGTAPDVALIGTEESAYDIRVRLYGDTGTKDRILKAVNIRAGFVESSAASLEFTLETKSVGGLDAPFVVGVELSSTATAKWETPRNNLFIMTKSNADNLDATGTVTYTGIGYIPWLLARAVLYPQPWSKDGERVWPNLPGARPVRSAIGEAQDRGWAPFVTYDWTTDVDSNGVAWPNSTKTDISFQHGTNVWTILEQMTTQGLLEWWTEGTKIRAFVPGTGIDQSGWLTLGGVGFQSAPVDSDFDDVFTNLTVFSDKIKKPVQIANTGAATRFGRLEASMSQSGVKTAAEATKLAGPTLKDGKGIKRSWTFEWRPAKDRRFPLISFNIGDLVRVKTRTGWETQRVIGIVASKTDTGVTFTVATGTRIRSLYSKVVKLSNAVTVGSGVGGSGSVVPATPSVPGEDPAVPTGLYIISNTAFFHTDGTARAAVEVGWNPVTQTVDAAELTVVDYQVYYKKQSAAGWRSTTTIDPQVRLDTLESGVVYNVKVRARSAQNVYSEFSTVLNVTPSTPSTPPSPPTQPQLSSALGMLTVTWNGQLSTGAPLPGFKEVFVEIQDGAVWKRVGQTLTRAGASVVSGLAVGATVTVRLIASSILGNLSAPSPTATTTIQGVALPDVAGDLENAITDALTAAETAKTTADGKNRIIVSTTTPPGSAYTPGDLWYVRDPAVSTRFTGVRVWSGSTWVNYQLVANSVLVPGSVGGTLIQDGQVTSTKMATTEIWSNVAWLGEATANLFTAGKIQTFMMNAAAELPQGGTTNRWPWRMQNNQAEIARAIATGAEVHGNENNLVTAGNNGIVLTVPTSMTRAISGITPRMKVPPSRKLYYRGNRWLHANGGNVVLQVRTWDGAGNHITWNDGGNQPVQGSGVITLSDTAAEYGVIVAMSPPSPGTYTDAQITELELFEVIGNRQAVEITPSGVRLFDTDGNPRLSLSTSGDDVLDISQKNAQGETVSVASIDTDGSAVFQSLDISDDATFQGSQLVGSFASDPTDGMDLSDIPMFDRFGRGIVALGSTRTDGWVDVTHTRAAIASFTVNLLAGRMYQFAFIGNAIGSWSSGSSDGNHLQLRVNWSTSTQSISAPVGDMSNARAVDSGAANGAQNYINYLPFQEFKVGSDGDYNVLAYIYNPGNRRYSFYPGNWPSNPSRIVVSDLGPAVMFDGLDNFTSNAYQAAPSSGGGSSGSTTPPASTKTRVWNASWSVLWGPSGSIRPAGSSLYDDGRMLQGGLSGSRAGRVGFPALGLSGKTIKGAWLRVKVRHTYSSAGATLRIGTHGNSSEPTGSAPNSVNTFTKKVKKGQDLWIPIPSSLWGGIASGSIRGFQIGGPDVNTGRGDYVILDGYSTSNAATSNGVRPQLKVTYR